MQSTKRRLCPGRTQSVCVTVSGYIRPKPVYFKIDGLGFDSPIHQKAALVCTCTSLSNPPFFLFGARSQYYVAHALRHL